VNFTPFLTVLAGGHRDIIEPGRAACSHSRGNGGRNNRSGARPGGITTAYAAGVAEQYVTPFSLSVNIIGQAVITPPYQSGPRPGVSVPEQTLAGFGVAFFGIGGFCASCPWAWACNTACTRKLGLEAVFPGCGGPPLSVGPTSAGEFYLQGGIGLNFTTYQG